MGDALTEEQLVDSGLLHRVNEDLLWPLGLTMTVRVPTADGTRRWDPGAGLRIDDVEEPVVTALSDEDHAALHARHTAWLNGRARIANREPTSSPALTTEHNPDGDVIGQRPEQLNPDGSR